MKFNAFFRITWLVQLLVGISLFSVSFLIESKILQAFISTPLLAMLLAGALELGKAGAIIWHRYMSHRSTMEYPKLMRFTSSIFRLGLVFLSVLCSLLFLSDNLDRPNLETIKNQEITLEKTHLKSEIQRLEKNKTLNLEQFTHQQEKAFGAIKQGFDQRIGTLEKQLTTEMNNVINGTFKGPRYAEFTQQLNQEKDQRKEVLNQLARQQKTSLNTKIEQLTNNLEKKRSQLYKQYDSQRKTILNKDFANDERANDARIVSFLKVYESIFNTSILPLQFVFIFSLLLSLLMEVGIMLAFDTITLSILPLLKASHESDLSKDILDTEIDRQAKEDAARHTAAVNRIRNTADNVMHKANEYINANG